MKSLGEKILEKMLTIFYEMGTIYCKNTYIIQAPKKTFDFSLVLEFTECYFFLLK